ncbi:hypothetical protein L2E82_50844 [Cichorium intybus]|nr:hypothetical protein L2E82_50844 [Cichorium intybus]
MLKISQEVSASEAHRAQGEGRVAPSPSSREDHNGQVARAAQQTSFRDFCTPRNHIQTPWISLKLLISVYPQNPPRTLQELGILTLFNLEITNSKLLIRFLASTFKEFQKSHLQEHSRNLNCSANNYER